MSTYTVRIDVEPRGRRVTVKDLIDMRGHRTFAGSAAVRATAAEAVTDAACLAGVRAAEARGEATIVGRTTLDEFACGATGINEAFGTATNPLDPARIPGGSSSGGAASVASGDADVALGTDTGGSVRIPAACCGVAGLKPTHGRVSLRGVHPLSHTLDTVGVMARTVDDLEAGFELLDPRFEPTDRVPERVGRLVFDEEPNEVDAAIDAALAAAGFDVQPVPAEGWTEAHFAALTIVCAEGWANNAAWITGHRDLVSAAALATLGPGADISADAVADAHRTRLRWVRRLEQLLEGFDVLACPTLSVPPPPIAEAGAIDWATFSRTMPVNLAGLPALALPVRPLVDGMPPSLQFIGRAWEEPLLLAAARRVTSAR